jgi:hypothetical protein
MKTKYRKTLIYIASIMFTIVLIYNFILVGRVNIKFIKAIPHPESFDIHYEKLLESGSIDSSYQSPPNIVSSFKEFEMVEQKLEQSLPNIDFDKNYLYISSNRKITDIKYLRFWKNKQLDYYSARIKYDPIYYKGKSFLYLSDKIKVK